MLQNLIGKLRDLKITYILYNFFHKKKLRHNQLLYRQFKIKKPLYWSVSSVDFATLPAERPWLDEPGAKEKMLNHPAYQQLPIDSRTHLADWIDNGFIVIKISYRQPRQTKLITK